jgi:hypothetical protein
MNKGGFLQYKCRRCGEIVQDTHVPDLQAALLYILNDWDMKIMGWTGVPANKTDTHRCKKDEWGVIDLIGGVEDKEATHD